MQTQSSNRYRGIHDVREEIRFEGRPDLVVHDSGGFEAGADDEFQAIEAFLKEKSTATDVMERLHVIWFCVDINSARTLQTATEKLFQAIGQYAGDVPVIVVATKKDDLLDIEFGTCRKAMKKEGKRFDEEACEEYAAQKLQERVNTIREEMQTVPDGRLDACVAISQGKAVFLLRRLGKANAALYRR
jgi:GTPase SAR1 family protein